MTKKKKVDVVVLRVQQAKGRSWLVATEEGRVVVNSRGTKTEAKKEFEERTGNKIGKAVTIQGTFTPQEAALELAALDND